MSLGDKLFKPKGWSSKKFAGLYLVFWGALLTTALTLIAAIGTTDMSVVEVSIPGGSLIASGLACFGVDAVNKSTKAKSNV